MNEHAYLGLLRECLEDGVYRDDRTGTGTRGLFGRQIRFDLAKGFPLLTTKKVFLKGIIYELLWFLQGNTNAGWLEDRGVKIWAQWGDAETRELGPVYGKQWRNWETPIHPLGELPLAVKHTDQIADLVEGLRRDPNSRRHLVVAWNPGEVADMALPPCHCLFQFYVVNNKLSCQLYQRSADIFLGVPFNIASYALLTMMIAQQCGFELGDFVHTFGDVHLYCNHFEQAREQLSRDPYPFPEMQIDKAADIFSYEYESFHLHHYTAHAAIKAPVAV